MTRLYIVGPGHRGEGIYTLVHENGEGLASHFCSHAGFAYADLEARRPERQKEWRERFGDYRVLWIGDDDMTEDALLAANKARADSQAGGQPEPRE